MTVLGGSKTKGSLFASDLRSTESARIACGKVHFNALSAGESPARYEAATRVEELLVGMGVG